MREEGEAEEEMYGQSEERGRKKYVKRSAKQKGSGRLKEDKGCTLGDADDYFPALEISKTKEKALDFRKNITSSSDHC